MNELLDEADEQEQRELALLMAVGGLRPRDIAVALNVDERQVWEWLRPDKRGDG